MKFWSKLPALVLLMAASFFPNDGFGDESTRPGKPNFVWIVSEDNSTHYLDHFFAGGAATPNISKMAKQGLTFRNAFSNSPVCSVARTTLATSCYAPRIGTQFHRRYQLAPMPHPLKMFPAYLRTAGYYTTNNCKKRRRRRNPNE